MAEHFKCIYVHCDKNIHLCTKLDGDYSQKVYTVLERIKNAFRLIPEEYVMWLEDDVSVNHAITDTFRYDINGFCPNTYSPEMIDALCQTYPLQDRIYRWSGHGGSVFHKTNILICLENKDILDDVLTHWSKYHLTADICHDFLISLLVNLQGGTVGSYEGTGDGYHGLNPFIKVQHQYKVWYNTPLPPELVHLIN
jgi:hypothetical protein